MLRDLILWIVSVVILQPLESEIGRRLTAAGAPAAVVQDVRTCATASLPAIADRAASDWVWTATTAFGVWTGGTSAEAALASAAPACAGALNAARPFLSGGVRA